MTVPANKNKTITAGDGVNTVFTFDYPLLADADMTVQNEDALGVITIISPSSYTLAYTIGDPAGGTATITNAPDIPATGEKLILERVVDPLQDSDYKDTREIPADTIETDFDRRAMVEQQFDEQIGRSLKIPITSVGISSDLLAPLADALLGWNSAGTAVTNIVQGAQGSADLPPITGSDGLKIVQANSIGSLYQLGAKIPEVVLADAQKILDVNAAGDGFDLQTFIAKFQEETDLQAGGIFKWKKGADVASTASMTLGDDGNFFSITGTTGITSITAKTTGTEVKLRFNDVLTVTDGGNLKLQGNFVTANESVLVLISDDGVNWIEKSRSPAIIISNDAIMKGWINFNGTGTIATRDSFNVTSIFDNGVGDYTINWDTDFANTNYCITATVTSEAAPGFRIASIKNGTVAVGSVGILVFDDAGVLRDADTICVQAIGDQ